jgi:asparagine synthase (glutamine-hydrolysing)
LTLPTSLKVQGLSKKRLLRDAARPLLPRSIIDGRKRGFSIPAAAWLRGKMEPFAREVLSPAQVRRRGYLRPEAVTGILDRHVAGAEDLSRQIWGLLMLSLWLDEYGIEA